MKFVKSVFICMSIWVLASLLNAVLCTIWLSVFTTQFASWPVTFVLSLIFSLLFSIPGMFIFWLLFIVNCGCNLLFQKLLKAGLVISLLSSLMGFLFEDQFKGQKIFLLSSVVIAALCAIMTHHTLIKNNFNFEKN